MYNIFVSLLQINWILLNNDISNGMQLGFMGPTCFLLYSVKNRRSIKCKFGAPPFIYTPNCNKVVIEKSNKQKAESQIGIISMYNYHSLQHSQHTRLWLNIYHIIREKSFASVSWFHSNAIEGSCHQAKDFIRENEIAFCCCLQPHAFILHAFAQISPENCEGHFRNCGYE